MNKPYDTAAILRQNIADLERELLRQRERADKAESAMASAREDLQSFIDSRDAWMARANAAEAELRAAREQEPVATVDAGDDGYFADILPDRTVKVGQSLYTRPIPAPAPAVPEEWREVMQLVRDYMDDAQIKPCNPDYLRKRVRALLQSAGENP